MSKKMTMASTFSGIGGEMIAAEMMGWDVKFFCENNAFCNRVLSYWFPKAANYEDVTTTDFSKWRGRINVLTGGIPCQPFSYAGQRRGATDDRYLWPHMFRCINEIKPDWVVCENVVGITTMVEQGEVSAMASQATLFEEGDGVHRYRLDETFTIERICNDLESNGYSVQPMLVPAVAVGAPHRRDRVFIVGHREDGTALSEDAVCSRQLRGEHEEQGNKRNVWDSGPRGDERLCGEAQRTDTPDSDGDGHSTQETCGGTEGCGRTDDGKQSERSKQAQRTERLYSLLRNIPYPYGGPDEGWNAFDPECFGRFKRQYDYGVSQKAQQAECGEQQLGRADRPQDRWRGFPTVSPVCGGDDGLPFSLDHLTIPFADWQAESLRAYGNAIVAQVVMELFKAIQKVEDSIGTDNNKPKKNKKKSI